MSLKALPVAAVGYNWSGAYAGVNVGVVWDRNDLGLVTLTSPGFVVADPTGAMTRITRAYERAVIIICAHDARMSRRARTVSFLR